MLPQPAQGWSRGMVWDNPSVLHLSWTLFLLLLHQHRLRSSGIRSQRLGAPVLGDLGKKRREVQGGGGDSRP